jgi:hypothetical protein
MFHQLHARFDDLDNLLYEYAVEADEHFERVEPEEGLDEVSNISAKVRTHYYYLIPCYHLSLGP